MAAADVVKVALVTGAAVRIGRSIAMALHKQGYQVIIHCNTSLDQANQLRDTLNFERGSSARVLQADLSKDTSTVCKTLIDSGVQMFGRLDVLVNSAASYARTPIGSITDESWAAAMDTNLKAPVFLAQAAIPHLRAVHGSIINITDLLGDRPSADRICHCISKAALASATQCLALAAAPQVRVNAVTFGAVEWPVVTTEEFKQAYISKTPLGRVGTAEEAADAVVFLASERASFITGQVFAVDGGRALPL